MEQEAEVTKEEGYEPVCEVLDEWPDPEDLDELDTAVKVTKPKVTEAKKPTEKAQPSDKPKKDKPVQEEVTVAKSKELHQQTPKLSKDKSLLRAKPKPIELIDGVAEKFVNEGEDVEIQWKLNGECITCDVTQACFTNNLTIQSVLQITSQSRVFYK